MLEYVLNKGHLTLKGSSIKEKNMLPKVLYRLMEDDVEEIDRGSLSWKEAYNSQPPRKEHLEIWCEICYVCTAIQLPGVEWAHAPIQKVLSEGSNF